MTVEEAIKIWQKTKSPYLKRDMEKFIRKERRRMKNNTVILAPHSYVVVHRKQPNIYDVYEIGTGKWILSRTNPDDILRIFSVNCCTFKFIDENAGEIYGGSK